MPIVNIRATPSSSLRAKFFIVAPLFQVVAVTSLKNLIMEDAYMQYANQKCSYKVQDPREALAKFEQKLRVAIQLEIFGPVLDFPGQRKLGSGALGLPRIVNRPRDGWSEPCRSSELNSP